MRKRICTLLIIAILATSGAVFAETQQINPKNMSLNEYADWIEENVEPREYEGIKKGNREIREWLYTGEEYNTIYNGLYDYIGWMATEAKWLVNERLQVLDYGTVTFRHGKARESITAHPHSDSAWIANDNVRLIYQVDFVEWSGDHYITHMYNLHGNGKVSLRVIN
ncbi:hypothetical protein KQI41_05100 [Tissierella pigra]|uniref:Uncharacterized protein n=1 Tax=Tissierella pigra TaxID=2607614 RepID=A0A6N7XIL9_9FIRM|nr:hypothetical protein [Tissierella pigra]MBU5425786.1 hypothetical protein [Tissierella pigra]MSU01476.1 hypothetical protein [Tissierella pigra]